MRDGWHTDSGWDGVDSGSEGAMVGADDSGQDGVDKKVASTSCTRLC